jgi:hypothetical protein
MSITFKNRFDFTKQTVCKVTIKPTVKILMREYKTKRVKSIGFWCA